MGETVHEFLEQLASAPPSRVVPTIKSANKKELECIRQLCSDIMHGKIPKTSLPKETRKWFHGVAHGRHKNIQSFKRSITQRGGGKAELIGQAMKAVAKVALPALKNTVAPLVKQTGKKLVKQAAQSALEEGSQALVGKLTTKKKRKKPQKDEPLDDDLISSKKKKVHKTPTPPKDNSISSLSVDEILAREW